MVDLYSMLADTAADPLADTLRVQGSAFNVRSQLAVMSGVDVVSARHATRGSRVRSAVLVSISLAIVVIPFALGMGDRHSISGALKVADRVAASSCPAGRWSRHCACTGRIVAGFCTRRSPGPAGSQARSVAGPNDGITPDE